MRGQLRSRLAVGLAAALGVVAVALALPGSSQALGDRAQAQLTAAREFTSALRTPEQAEAAGWFDSGLPCFDAPGSGGDNGGMGYHWLRKAPNADQPDPRRPEALVFDPVTHRLVAVEYVILKSAWVGPDPKLFGKTFTEATLPDGTVVYKLHAWIWKRNPNGMFADFNPRVSLCP